MMEKNKRKTTYENKRKKAAILSHNHQFNWWFTLGPDKGRLLLPPKGGMLQACYWSTTKWYYSLLSSIRHSALQCTFLSQIL